MIERLCKECGKSFPQYNTTVTICQVCAFNRYSKPAKPITRIGKRTKEYNKWRLESAVPYLDNKYGHKCAICGADGKLDVDHIKKRGSHPELKMELTNVRWLCRPCHVKET